MEEIWKDIPGYEGEYQISNTGKVKSLERSWIRSDGKLHTVKEKVLQIIYASSGYAYVNLRHKPFYIARCVLTLFQGAPTEYNPDGTKMKSSPEINHRDEDKTNNSVENLEWCDRQYNINYGTRNERMARTNDKYWTEDRRKAQAERIKKNIPSRKGTTWVYKNPTKYLCIETGEILTAREAKEKYNAVSVNNAANLNNPTKTSGGYHWKNLGK